MVPSGLGYVIKQGAQWQDNKKIRNKYFGSNQLREPQSNILMLHLEHGNFKFSLVPVEIEPLSVKFLATNRGA